MKKRKLLKRLFLLLLVIPVIIFSALVAILFYKQDAIVQEVIATANQDFKGHFVLRDSHISPFVNFPYISIDLEDLELYETKDTTAEPVLKIKDLYVGLDIWTVLKGNFEIKRIKASDGYVYAHQYTNGEFNILNALAPVKEDLDPEEEFHLNLKRIDLEHFFIEKMSDETGMSMSLDISRAQTNYRSFDGGLEVGLNTAFNLSVIQDSDTSFIRQKPFEIDTKFDFNDSTHVIEFHESEVKLANAIFKMNGEIDIDDNARLDLAFEGRKKDFELLIAFAPDELIPTLRRYENAGDIFFKAEVSGPCINGNDPYFIAEFGCENGFFNNSLNDKRLDEMQFRGYFTNGEARNTSTMAFGLENFSARPEAGIFSGSLEVINFDSPDINLSLDSDFDLDFLAKFLNVEQLQELRGHVLLKMNFHDIIDLSRPELNIEKFNESYYTELHVTDLGFTSPDFHLPIEDIDIRASMDGHKAQIEHFRFKAGKTDFALSGAVDDLPAILHHTNIPVNAKLKVRSERIDLYELTAGDTLNQKPFNEVLTDLNLDLAFKASARAFTESKNLPIGEFLVEDLDVTLQNYPHRLHDFTADLFIEEVDFSIIDFSGIIDDSDFHFSGRLTHYDLWFEDAPHGDTFVEFDLDSKLLRFEDIFSYGGENYMPEDYRHEEFRNLNLHGRTAMHFKDSLYAFDFYLDDFTAKMKMHPMKLEAFKGRAHLEDRMLNLNEFGGKMGRSDFKASMAFQLDDKETDHKNTLFLRASRLDFDELLAWEETDSAETIDHDAVFSVFDIPFPDLEVTVEIDQMNYHKYLVSNIRGKLRSTKHHQLYLEPLHMELASGSVDLSGYFNGENREAIYFSPQFTFEHLDLDQLMVKFDNFGQDAIVAENLHGYLSGSMNGKIIMHADLVPIIETSEIHMDVEVVAGRLDDYEPMQALADYFQDKNLNRVAFDTLSNHIDLVNGQLSIPNMRIHSTLGYLELSGKQDMEMNMDYLIRVPWKMVTSAGSQRLFGSRNKTDLEGDDEIIQSDPNRRTRFVNVRMTGTPDDFRVSLAGKRRVLGGS